MRRNNYIANDDNNVFWVTMSDLMLGLAIIFITMFVLAMTGFTQEKISQQQVKMDAAEKIEQALQKNNINASVNKYTADLKISDVDLFEINSYVLSDRGKKLLDKLAPIYINTIFSDKELSVDIQNIIIQGHTDSQTFAGLNSKEDQFIKNMDLSLKRANAVAEYMIKTNYNKKYSSQLQKAIIVQGKSYNEPILVNGKEDYNKSRRVELKLKINSNDVTKALGIIKE